MSQLKYRVEVKEHEDGFAFIEIPLELLEELGWQIDDVISVEETEVCDNEGETQGLVLSRSIL
tara:strand:+ start:147 stop:335 length:189 start_codon:yes stop_codon:yes gene_type:complete